MNIILSNSVAEFDASLLNTKNDFYFLEIKHLREHVGNGEADTVNLNDILDYLTEEECKAVLITVKGKLKSNGKLILKFLDVYAIASQFVSGVISDKDYVRFMYYKEDQPKKTAIPSHVMKEILDGMNFKLVKFWHENNYVALEAFNE